MKSMSFTVFIYNATVLLIQPNPAHQMCWKMRPNPTQPNPTHGWTQPMSISGTGLPRLSWKRPLNGSSSSLVVTVRVRSGGTCPGNRRPTISCVSCVSVSSRQVLAMYSSSYVLTATAVDRYLVICHPLRAFAWSRRRLARTLIGGAWAGAGLLSLPQLGIWAYREVTHHTVLIPGSSVVFIYRARVSLVQFHTAFVSCRHVRCVIVCVSFCLFVANKFNLI